MSSPKKNMAKAPVEKKNSTGARQAEKKEKAAASTRLPTKSGAKLPAVRAGGLPAEREARPPARLPDPVFSAQTPSSPGTLGANPYLPDIATVVEVIRETPLIVTLRLKFDDPERGKDFSFRPGQVAQISVFGAGEATFVINSPPSQKEYLQFSVMKAGEATTAVHKLTAGDKVGLRAPLGNSFPFEQWKGKDVFFIGGGIGMAPIRTIMLHLLDNAKDYGAISLLYGARAPRDMAYGYELEGWLRHAKLKTTLTIDAPAEGWEHKVGLIPNVLLDLAPKPQNGIAVLCGPPIMIKFTLQALEKLGFSGDHIFTTLEKRMKCGIGICGRCNIGHTYVCVDGPVFSLAKLNTLPDEL